MKAIRDREQMTTTDVTTGEKLETISRRLEELDQQITDLHTQVADLDEAGVCTGSAYWRDRGNGKQAKLYLNHGIDQSCPIHGQPGPGKRIRAYVGADSDRQAAALAALERCEQKAGLKSQIRQVEVQRNRIERDITNAWHAATGQQQWRW